MQMRILVRENLPQTARGNCARILDESLMHNAIKDITGFSSIDFRSLILSRSAWEVFCSPRTTPVAGPFHITTH